MMKYLIFIFIITSFKAFVEDTVTCANLDSNNFSEIMSLISTVKNNVLGVTPKFCREKKSLQLAEQVGQSESELDSYVRKLNELKLEKKDIMNLAGKNKDKISTIIIRTSKTIILKKMWNQISDDNRYALLVSEACEDIGLNRLPFYNNKPSTNKKLEGKQLLAFKAQCKAKTFADIAPYMTNDVVAELLLNMKINFPDSFQNIIGDLCHSFAETDEALFKNNDLIFADKDSSHSVKNFSGWLSKLYEKIGLNESGYAFSKEMLESNLKYHETQLYQDQDKIIRDIPGITSADLDRVTSYTKVNYTDTNTCLRYPDLCSTQDKERVASIKNALSKIKASKGNQEKVIFRGTTLPSDMLNSLSKNPKGIVLDKAFMSFSGEASIAKEFIKPGPNSVLLILKTKSCVGISELSGIAREDEFLCPPALKVNVKKMENEKNTYILEEAS